ncbi:hypothetical protein EV363DRAFT_1495220 [Boletus edulis]|nr:hypothetical protein EV363DRAFT_1495220 [Boletus edulis]
MGAPMEEHCAEKRRWEERDGQMQELMEMVSRLLDEQAAPPRSPPSPPARRHQTWEEAPLRERVPEPRQVWYRPRPHIPPPLEDMPLARPPSRRPPRLQTWEEAPSPREPVPEPRQTWYRPRPRIPSLPEDMPPARPPSRRPPSPQTWEEAPPPREPVPEPVQVPSLVTWQPNPARSPTSLSVEPPQPLPDCGSPGLFGHTNRRNNSSPEPVRTPRGDWSSSPEPILPVPHSLSPSPDGYIPIG